MLVKINFLVSKKAIALVVILIQITNLEHYTRVHGDEVSDGGVHGNGGAHEVEDVLLFGDGVLDALHLGHSMIHDTLHLQQGGPFPSFVDHKFLSRMIDRLTWTAMTERTSTVILLNSSKQPHAPVWARPWTIYIVI